MALIVLCRLPFRIAAFPRSVGILTLSNMRMGFPPFGGKGSHEEVTPLRIESLRPVLALTLSFHCPRLPIYETTSRDRCLVVRCAEAVSAIVPGGRSMLFLVQTLRKCNEEEYRSIAHSCWHRPRKPKSFRDFAFTTPIPEVLKYRSRSSASVSAS